MKLFMCDFLNVFILSHGELQFLEAVASLVSWVDDPFMCLCVP